MLKLEKHNIIKNQSRLTVMTFNLIRFREKKKEKKRKHILYFHFTPF